MQKNNNRGNRVDEEVKKQVSSIIMNDIKDPNLTGLISVTKAKITPDLKYAKIYVSILNSKNIKRTMEGLQSASGFIRSQIAKNINLRVTPQLTFEIDDSFEYGAKIDAILKELKQKGEEE